MQFGPGVDVVHDIEVPIDSWEGSIDHVMCCSVLEHVRRPWLAAENVQRWMRPGATIQISVPFVWRVHGYPNDYWRFTVEGIKVLFPEVEWEVCKLHYGGKFHEPPKVRAVDKMFPRTEVHMFGRKTGDIGSIARELGGVLEDLVAQHSDIPDHKRFRVHPYVKDEDSA